MYFGLIFIITLVIFIDKYLSKIKIEKTTFKYPSVREQLQNIVKWNKIHFVEDYLLAGYRVYYYEDVGTLTKSGYYLNTRFYTYVPFTAIKFNKNN